MKMAQEYGIEDDLKREEMKIEEEKKNAQKEAILWKKKVLMQAH